MSKGDRHIPLRIHSVYSKGKGGVTVGEAAAWVGGSARQRAAEAGNPAGGRKEAAAGRRRAPAAALADFANLYGWGKWRRAADGHGFKPLFGCEMELGTGGRRFLFLVKSREGYWNLMEIFNRREIRRSEGLITIRLPERDGAGEKDGTEMSGGEGGGDLYIGCDFSNFRRAADVARRSGLPLVWANPLKYVGSPERLILLRAIEKKTPYPPERAKLAGGVKLYGPDQAALALREFGALAGEAFSRTFEVAEKCEFRFEDIVPPLPAGLFPKTLREVVMARLAAVKDLSWKERQRARHELDAVEASGFAPYFLIVHDVVEFARRRGILHNLRGSGASSFLTYLLGIAHINPLEFDLYFERFLNRGRPDPPDIDIDFDSRRRDEVLTYVLDRYGRGQTGAAFVCSLKNFRARSALYETARAFGIPPQEARSMSQRVPYFAEPEFLRKDAPASGCLDIWKLASELDGVHAEISLHVGGVILTPAPAERYLPLDVSAKGFRMCHFDKDAVEDLRLIKLDLLSVRGLAAISGAKEALGLQTLPAADPKIYRMLGGGKTIGCFQVESPAMMNLLRRMKPGNVHELTQALALVRPGPTESGMKEALLRGREGKERRRDASLQGILPETDGILLYEEQVMQIAERVAGMPPEEGDLLRRSLKRKGGSPELRMRFLHGAGRRGYAAGEVEKLWKTMEKFSSYSFNKAHSASYAHMACQAVYLKAHHTVPYMAAVLNAGGGYYGPEEYIEESKRLGIRILPPDVNRSGRGFEVEGGSIRVGFSAIKGLAVKVIDRILGERTAGGEFLSVEDFLIRIGLSKSDLLSLIRAGVFDSLEPRRARQVLRYFQGIEDMAEVADISPGEKERMLVSALGFSPGGDTLDLFEGKRPPLRIRDLKDRIGGVAELVVRVVDARQIPVNGGRKFFYMFEDETGLLEGVGETKCLASGSPPACCLRGEVRASGPDRIRIVNCSFLRSF